MVDQLESSHRNSHIILGAGDYDVRRLLGTMDYHSAVRPSVRSHLWLRLETLMQPVATSEPKVGVANRIWQRLRRGWICPVGFLQDVITGIKGRVDSVQTRTHEYWIRLKYVLVGITFLISGTLGLALYNGVGSDYQQSLGPFASGLFIAITPDGTLFGTLPLILAHSWRFLGTAQVSDFSAANLGSWLGGISALTWINILILIGFIYAAWRIPRFWCRYICPVGGIMAVFQKNSLLGMHRDPIKCSNCKECETACPMQIPILDLDWKKFNDSECILCMACIDACPAGALSPKFP